jgi:hypothetical protein
MRRTTAITAALVLMSMLGANDAHAAAAFQFSAPNVQFPKDPHVSGLRLSVLHGKNQSQRGLDLGMLSMSETSRLSGLALVAGLGRVTGEMSNGVALSAVNWHSGRDSGVNGAFVNIVNDTERAFNVGFVNVAEGGTMVDLGGFNMSKRSTAQIGFLNVTDQIKGFQFGFLNLAKNGFLPIFPVINFPKN